jgi:hypothetical protein
MLCWEDLNFASESTVNQLMKNLQGLRYGHLWRVSVLFTDLNDGPVPIFSYRIGNEIKFCIFHLQFYNKPFLMPLELESKGWSKYINNTPVTCFVSLSHAKYKFSFSDSSGLYNNFSSRQIVSKHLKKWKWTPNFLKWYQLLVDSDDKNRHMFIEIGAILWWVLSVSCRKMVRRVGRVLVLTVGLPALTPTLLLKAACATLATNIGGINNCVKDTTLGICRDIMLRSFCFCYMGWVHLGMKICPQDIYIYICIHTHTHTLPNLT